MNEIFKRRRILLLNNVPSKLVVFESGKRALSAGSIVNESKYSFEYSFTNTAIKIGGGSKGKVSIQGIDFTNYTKLCLTAKTNTAEENPYVDDYYVGYGDTKATNDSGSNKVRAVVPKTKKTLTFDIKNVTGNKYIYLGCYVDGGAYVEVYDIWLE